MNKQKLTIVATLTIIVSLSIVGIAGLDGRVKADIPFDFTVGGKEFKAGKYSVGRLRLSSSNGTLIIRSADNNQAANFNTNNVTDKSSSGARLVFRRYGNQYFLAQIFDGLSNQGAELSKSKGEREAAKKRDIITQNVIEPEMMTVFAKIGQ
ncbi:MAG: hypothetical protein L0220_18575 [Acidobacteria bacterium]|nr:hypothetical protein [Acidobacteriota bacterium]